MNLGEYADWLYKHPDEDLIFPIGFSNPHSYRGVYEDLAFVVTANVPVKQMLAEARECFGKTFEGYKGGDFTMHEHTTVHFMMYKYAVFQGAEINELLLRLLFNLAESTIYINDKAHGDVNVDPDWFLQDYREGE